MADEDVEVMLATARGGATRILADRSVRDLATTLDRLVEVAVASVPGADAAGLVAWEQGRPATLHASGAEVSALDRVQADAGAGPSFAVVDEPPESGALVVDLADPLDRRWPAFATAAARDAGVCSMIAVHLAIPGESRVLNLYARVPGAFDERAGLTAAVFGLQAGPVLHGAEHVAQLTRALESRDVIGQAKGVLMERFGLDDQGAFGMLVSSSQSTNMKLADVARWLVDEAATRADAARTRRPED